MWFSSLPLALGGGLLHQPGTAEVTLSRLRRRGTSRSEVGKVSTDSRVDMEAADAQPKSTPSHRPILVTGVPRSGTTWLARLLAHAPHTAPRDASR